MSGAMAALLFEHPGGHVARLDFLAPLGAPWLAAPLLALGGWALSFVRLSADRILTSSKRRAIYAEIEASPWLPTIHIVRRTGIAESVVRHHLLILEQHGLVRSCRRGLLRLWRPAGGMGGSRLLARGELHVPARWSIAALVAQAEEGLTQRQIAERSGLSLRLVSHHLGRLEACGLVRGSGDRPRAYRAGHVLQEALPPRPGLCGGVRRQGAIPSEGLT